MEIILTPEGLGKEHKEVSKEDGKATFLDVPEGDYIVTAKKDGFKFQQEILLGAPDSPSYTAAAADLNQDGKIDVLVNNAGLGQDVAAITELSDEHWQQVIDVTLTGTFFCCRSAGRWMRRQESGAIVNISSINGVNPASLVAAYNVAKAGVISLTRTLALELAAYGVRVNAVCPGPVYTDFNQRVMAQRCESLGIEEEEMIERVRQAIPLGRWGEPADIASAVGFLCSRSASWMTGELVRVSGGLEGVSAAPPKQPLPEAEL